MEMTNSLAFTREAAKQSMKNEVRLNAAYIEGDWVTIAASESVDEHALYDPNSGEVIAKTHLCNSTEVESAAHAASRAYATWSQTSVNERHRMCRRLQIRWRSSLISWLRCRY